MFPIIRLNKDRKNLLRSALLGGIACATLYLGACDLMGNAYKNEPILPSNKNKMMDETSHIEWPFRKSKSKTKPDELNPKNLFGKDLGSEAQRLDRLERAMQDLRSDFDAVRPSIKRLMTVESDLQNLVGELRRLSGQAPRGGNDANLTMVPPPNPAPQMAKAAPAAMPKKSKVKRKAPPPLSGAPTVYDVRVGEHPGKTRVVLDTNGKTSFSIDVDNNEKIMIVDLPQAQWSAAQSKKLFSKTLDSYRVEQSGDGTLLIFQLKKATSILSQNEMGGTGGAGRRIVIDLQ